MFTKFRMCLLSSMFSHLIWYAAYNNKSEVLLCVTIVIRSYCIIPLGMIWFNVESIYVMLVRHH